MKTALLAALLAATALAGCAEDPRLANEAAAPPVVLLHTQAHSGMLPGPDSDNGAQAWYPVDVPKGATRLVVTHNATYTGLWPSVISIYPPNADEAKVTTLDSCSPVIIVHVQDSWSCVLELRRIEEAGTWMVEQWWQVGEAYEEFEITIEVFGHQSR